MKSVDAQSKQIERRPVLGNGAGPAGVSASTYVEETGFGVWCLRSHVLCDESPINETASAMEWS